MKMFKILVTLLGICGNVFSFPYEESSVVAAGAPSATYSDFTWGWNTYSDRKINATVPSGFSNVMFRMAYPVNSKYWLTIENGSYSGTVWSATVNRTNIPPNQTYFAEFLGYTTTNVGGSNVLLNTKVLAAGKVSTTWSVFNVTNAAVWQPRVIVNLNGIDSASLADATGTLWTALGGFAGTGTVASVGQTAENAYTAGTNAQAAAADALTTGQVAQATADAAYVLAAAAAPAESLNTATGTLEAVLDSGGPAESAAVLGAMTDTNTIVVQGSGQVSYHGRYTWNPVGRYEYATDQSGSGWFYVMPLDDGYWWFIDPYYTHTNIYRCGSALDSPGRWTLNMPCDWPPGPYVHYARFGRVGAASGGTTNWADEGGVIVLPAAGGDMSKSEYVLGVGAASTHPVDRALAADDAGTAQSAQSALYPEWSEEPGSIESRLNYAYSVGDMASNLAASAFSTGATAYALSAACATTGNANRVNIGIASNAAVAAYTGPFSSARRLVESTQSVAIAVLSDSTGKATNYWVYQWAQWFCSNYPTHTVEYNLDSTGTGFPLVPAMVHTGSAGLGWISFIGAPGGASLYYEDTNAISHTQGVYPFDVIAHIAHTNWASTTNMCIASRLGGDGNNSWSVSMIGPALNLYQTQDGSDERLYQQPLGTVSNVVGTNADYWIKVTVNISSGAIYQIFGYVSTNFPTWTQIGLTTGIGAYAIYSGTEGISVGSWHQGANCLFNGKIYEVRVTSTNGTDLVPRDLHQWSQAASTFADHAVWGGSQKISIWNTAIDGEAMWMWPNVLNCGIGPQSFSSVLVSCDINSVGLVSQIGNASWIDPIVQRTKAICPMSSFALISQNPCIAPLGGEKIWGHTCRRELLRAYAARNGLGYIDTYQAFLNTWNTNLISGDGIHPSTAGMTLWMGAMTNEWMR